MVFLQDNFYIIIETFHLGDDGKQENVHELDGKKLKERTVVPIDIANDAVAPADYKAEEDPTLVKSEKTGRGPLSGNWVVSFPTSQHLPTNPFTILGLMFAEHDQPGDDGLQAGLHPVQVVGTAEQGGELHPLNPAQTFHKLPQTGQRTSDVNSEF